MRKKSQSIRTRLILPIFAILVSQCILFLALMAADGFVQGLKDNAIAIFNENTENGRLYMEQEMVHRWMKVLTSDETVMEEIEHVLAEEGRKAGEIQQDAKLNQVIMEHLAQPMIDLLHRSFATGVFVVLDGPAAEHSEKGRRAGIYIRDLDSSSYVPDHSDLLLERGSPSISRAYGIPLDSFWELGFLVPEEEASSAYYHNPVKTAREHGASWEDRENYQYMSPPFSLHPMDTKVITCSVPLITKDGTVIGVIGLDMTLNQLEQLLEVSDNGFSGNTITFVGVREKGDQAVEPVVMRGSLYEHYFSNVPDISYQEKDSYNIEDLRSDDGTSWFVSVNKLETYGHNTPFEGEEWVLVRLVRTRELMAFYKKIQATILHVLAVTLLLGILGAFLIGHMLTEPIKQLIRDLNTQKNTGHLSLARLSIHEIDALTEAIEKLSKDVSESASKISSILEHANIPIGVYERRDDKSPVFCSRSLFEMMRWEHLDTPYAYMDSQEFVKRMKALEDHCVEDETGLYYFEDVNPRWVRLISVEQNNKSRLGVFTDVTADQMEKIKLERERDFDLLTNLYNRRAFKERVQKLIQKQPEMEFALIMWDMDNLKYINDTYGHDEGDRYLVMFAEKLHRLERDGGIISRYAGDEFLTLLYDEGGADSIRERLRAFMELLRVQTVALEGNYHMPIRVSAGAAWYPKDAKSFENLVTYADFAMYTAKHNMKGSLMEFDAREYASNSYMLEGQEELNRLFERETVDYAYQPIVDREGRLYGYELLMRPKLNTLRKIFEVLNLARAQAKLLLVECFTWRTALQSIHEHTLRGHLGATEKLFINSIASVCLPKQEVEKLEMLYGSYFKRIVMELTENEQMDPGSLEYKIGLVKKWGASIAIDDFGSGYNGESVLLSAKPDIVKLDMSLVRNIDKDRNRQLLLKNMVSYTKRAGMVSLAEGVETLEELELLMEFGIDLFQGYYVGRPELEIMPVSFEVADRMRKLSRSSD